MPGQGKIYCHWNPRQATVGLQKRVPAVCQGLCWELNSRQDKRGQRARDRSGQHRGLHFGTDEGQSWESRWKEGIKR